MATFEQCQREYDNQAPEEEPECPECGARILSDGFAFTCTSCTWFYKIDFGDDGGNNE